MTISILPPYTTCFWHTDDVFFTLTLSSANLLFLYDSLKFWHEIISKYKYVFWHYYRLGLSELFTKHFGDILYIHFRFRVRICSSFLGRAKTEWIVALRMSDAETNRTASLCKLSRRDVCLSELCLLQTNYNCGTGPRGSASFTIQAAASLRKHEIPFQLYTVYTNQFCVLRFSLKIWELQAWPRNFLFCGIRRLIHYRVYKCWTLRHAVA
jgi:hypothetical protein